MRRIIREIESKHLSKPVRISLARMLLEFCKKCDREVVQFTNKAKEHLDKQSVESEWQMDKFAETVDMLEQLSIDFTREIERIRK